MPRHLRRRCYEVLDVANPGDRLSQVVDVSLMTLVVLNVAAVVAESIPAMHAAHHPSFHVFEVFSVAIFSVEYLLRLWCAVESPAAEPLRRSNAGRRLTFALSPLAFADLVSILPFYLNSFFHVDLRFLRVLRVLRILKLTRYSSAMRTIGAVLTQERAALGTAFFILCMALVFVSSGIYLAEHRAQPGAFGSIPAAMWWAIVTLTTVGYGDVTPVTIVGKVFAASVAIVGVCVVALPTSILASGFAEVHRRQRARLEAEAELALADGYIDRDESEAFMELAERLGVDPRAALEIVNEAQRRYDAEGASCPKCGCSLDDA